MHLAPASAALAAETEVLASGRCSTRRGLCQRAQADETEVRIRGRWLDEAGLCQRAQADETKVRITGRWWTRVSVDAGEVLVSGR